MVYYILEMKGIEKLLIFESEYSNDSNRTTAWMFSVDNTVTDNDSCDTDGNEPNTSEKDQGKSESDDEDR